MSSDPRSFLSTPLLATAILAGALSGLAGLVGQFMRIMQGPNWEVLLQGSFVGLVLSVLAGSVWALRELWAFAWGREPEST
jgi:ABC-type uncharacterized transport system permease subunit